MGQVQIRSKPTLIDLITQLTNIKNCVLISYKPSAYSDILTLHIYFVIWTSSFMAKLAWPGNEEKKNNFAAWLLVYYYYIVEKSMWYHAKF